MENSRVENHRINQWLLLMGLILIGSNLRVPLTSVGTLITFIREDLGLTNALAGAITTLPLIAFAMLSPFAPKIANKIGMSWTVMLSMIVLVIGIGLRSVTGVYFLFGGTLLIGLAIAIGNVLIPAIVKINFPLKIGLMTGIYAIFMNVFGALGSGLSVPIASIEGFNWQGALGVWGILALLAILLWLPQLRKGQINYQVDVKSDEKNNLWQSKLAWKITLFMGSQSLLFYTLITWLPDLLHSKGYNAATAGWLVFLMQFSIIPFTFIVPIIAEKLKNQVRLSIITAGLFIFGLLAIWSGYPILIPLACIMLGIACGSAFSLSMMFFTLRTKDGKEAAEMSGMAQSFGYLLAAVGPVLIGILHDASGGWMFPIIGLLFIAVTILWTGIDAGKNGQVSGQTHKYHLKERTVES